MPDTTISDALREAREKIEIWKSENPPSEIDSEPLNLSGIGLTDKDMEKLMPDLESLQNLIILNLENNKLTKIPSTIHKLTKLEELTLNANALTELSPEIGQLTELIALQLDNNRLAELPEKIGQLTKLEVLHLKNNQLTELPPQIGRLSQLLVIDVSNNKLTTFPQEITQLNRLIDLNITRNPVLEDSLRFLSRRFPRRGDTTIKTKSKSIEKLKILYPELSPKEIKSIDMRIGRLNQERQEFTDGNDMKPTTLKGDEVVDAFLSHIEANYRSAEITGYYNSAAKHLLERAIGVDVQDSEAAITQMASSLGNCPTPVIDLMEKTAVKLAIESGKDKDVTLRTMLHRQAFEELAKKKRIIPAFYSEQIEIVQGLINSLFMEDSENTINNPLKIIGDRPRIAPKTQNIDFAFRQITNTIKDNFARLCCETDDHDKLVKVNRDKYVLDANKYYTITQSYMEKQGFLDFKARARKEHISQLKELLKKPQNKDLSVDLDLVNFEKIEDHLRLQMRGASDEQVNDIIQRNLEAYIIKMEQVREEYSPIDAKTSTKHTPSTNQNHFNANNSALEMLTIAGNQQNIRRTASREDNRNDTAPNRSNRRARNRRNN